MCTKIFMIFFCWVVCVTSHDFYASTDKVLSLIAKENELLQTFRYYIEKEEEHLQQLKRALMSLILLKTFQRVDLEMSNPVAAYKLMWRLREEWTTINTYTQKSPYLVYKDLWEEDLQQIPDKDDIDGAAAGIVTLQEMYKLPPEGIITDSVTGTKINLNMDQSFHLGKTAYRMGSYQHAYMWFLRCYFEIKIDEDEDEDTSVEQQVLNHLGISAYKFGNLAHALYFTQQLVDLDPTDLEARIDLALMKGESKHSTFKSNHDILTLNKTSSSIYEALCRGETVKMSRKKKQLTCRYSTGGGNPNLMYAPVKVEEEWDEPPIIRFHDIISETEIELLKKLSRSQLEMSQTQNEEGKSRVSLYRVSQSAALSEEDHPIVSQITQRLSDVTGMDMESADLLEVVNYGFGGQFKPHYDNGKLQSSEGYRIATIVIYLSDVTVGGATVFPEIGASLKPQKGTAVMWYNLLQNGQLDELSRHAGCPVFNGSKWIAIKWVREQGQEFRRPCALSETA